MKKLKVLFVGNSHTYVHDMPKIFKDLAKEKGIDAQVMMIAHPGWFLEKHLENPEVRFNILFGEYDYVVCQEHAHPFGPAEKMFVALRKIKEWVDQTNSKMVIYPTWARLKYPEDQAFMTESHELIAKELNVMLAPVDKRWYDDKDHLIDNFGPDGEHPSVKGSTIIAKTLLETILEDFNK